MKDNIIIVDGEIRAEMNNEMNPRLPLFLCAGYNGKNFPISMISVYAPLGSGCSTLFLRFKKGEGEIRKGELNYILVHASISTGKGNLGMGIENIPFTDDPGAKCTPYNLNEPRIIFTPKAQQGVKSLGEHLDKLSEMTFEKYYQALSGRHTIEFY